MQLVSRNLLWTALFAASIGWIIWPRQLLRDGQPLAVLTSVEGDVKLRVAGSFNWRAVSAGTPLFALDSLATGRGSSARFELDDATEVKVPEDTQLKIQTIALDKGVSISLAQGGISLQVKRGEGRSPVLRARRLNGAESPAPLQLQAAHYSIDLSALSGSLAIEANKPMVATAPEQIRIESPSGAIDLASLQASGQVALNTLIRKNSLEIQVPADEPAAAPEPATKPEASPTPSPPPLPVARKQALSFPQLTLSKFDYYWPQPLSSQLQKAFALPAVASRETDDSWQTVLQVSRSGQEQKILLTRSVGPEGFLLSLADLKSILPSGPFMDVELTVEPGLLQLKGTDDATYLSGMKSKIRLHSLASRSAQTLKLDRINFVAPDASWFSLSHKGPFFISIHLWQSSLFPALEGFLRGANTVGFDALGASAETAPVHIVRGSEIVASLSLKDATAVHNLQKQLDADLVFSGRKAVFLGGRGSFDLLQQMDNYPQIFYAIRERISIIDKGLMTQPVAQNFLRRLDPYYFSEPVEVLFNKGQEAKP